MMVAEEVANKIIDTVLIGSGFVEADFTVGDGAQIDLVKAVQALLPTGEWQPMATAPKTGSKVLILTKDIYAREGENPFGVSLGYWSEGRWWGGHITSHHQPFRWLPVILPEPPTDPNWI